MNCREANLADDIRIGESENPFNLIESDTFFNSDYVLIVLWALAMIKNKARNY